MSRPSHIRLPTLAMSFSVLFTAVLILLLLAVVFLFPTAAQ